MSIFMALLLIVLLPVVLLFLLALVRIAWRVVRDEPVFAVSWQKQLPRSRRGA